MGRSIGPTDDDVMTRFSSRLAGLAAVCMLCVTGAMLPAEAASSRLKDEPANCFQMMVVRVVDGDTIDGYIHTSDPVVAVRAKLRLAGLNAPEKGGRAKCPQEKVRGAEAKDYVETLLEDALQRRSRLLTRACDIRRGKYATRRIGRLEVRRENGWVDIGNLLLDRGLAVPSKRGRRTSDHWCSTVEGRLKPKG